MSCTEDPRHVPCSHTGGCYRDGCATRRTILTHAPASYHMQQNAITQHCMRAKCKHVSCCGRHGANSSAHREHCVMQLESSGYPPGGEAVAVETARRRGKQKNEEGGAKVDRVPPFPHRRVSRTRPLPPTLPEISLPTKNRTATWG